MLTFTHTLSHTHTQTHANTHAHTHTHTHTLTHAQSAFVFSVLHFKASPYPAVLQLSNSFFLIKQPKEVE
jgi:hypothetical protein